MRKFLFFALALVAGALAFTSCDPNDPNKPVDPKDMKLTGTMWRVDSVKMGNMYASQPYVIAKFISESAVVLDGQDTTTWSFNDGVLTIRTESEAPVVVTVVEATNSFAHVKMVDQYSYESPVQLEIFASIIPASNGQKVEPTVENIVGTWKMDYTECFYSGTNAQGNHYESYQMLASAQYHDLEIWEFRADGTYSVTYMLEKAMDMEQESWYQEGEWHLKDGKIALCAEDDPYLKDDSYNTFIELTTNVMYLKQTISSAWAYNVFKTYYSKIK